MSLILDIIFPRRCYQCRQAGDYFCKSCRKLIPLHSLYPNRLSLFRYDGAVKNAISDLKYNFVTDLAPSLIDFSVAEIKKYYPNLLKYWQKNNYVLVPIPLHSKRLKWRGFNQSEILGKEIASKLKLKYLPLLDRSKNTFAQAHLSKKFLRLQNLDHSFTLAVKQIPSRIIFFDDVYTTGSTINSVLSVFKKEPKNYWIFTLAS